MKNVAFLWWENEVGFEKDIPFGKQWKADDYAAYTELAEDRGMELYVADYRWYGNGSLEKAWHWNGEEWEKVEDVSLDGVYDLFRHDEEKMEWKRQMEAQVGIVNDPELTDICQDKKKTYDMIGEHMAETRYATEENVRELLQKCGRLVVKPRYGSSGEGIYLVTKPGQFNYSEDMLAQEFMEAEDLPQFGIEGYHDLRVIVIDGEVAGCHIRTPEEGFISNNAVGGNQTYVEVEDIPEEVMRLVDRINNEFERFQPAIFTVDVMNTDKGFRIVELNTQPGIYYHQEFKDKDYEIPMMEKVIDTIYKALFG